ncbi:phage portal protein [Nitrobacter sp.]|uniref:phage portal protein n=1 Tax=Nitrobacter sp. TaxID=29420 RepID=UPI003F64BEB1
MRLKFGMSFKSRFKSFLGLETKSSGTANPEPWLFDLFGGQPALAGVNVNARTAMECSAVNCAVRVISESIGQIPVRILRVGPDGSKTPAPDHPLNAMLSSAPNDFQVASRFRELVTRDALLHPGGFASIGRNSEGNPVELVRFDPDYQPISVDWSNVEPVYTLGAGTDAREIQRKDIIHIPSPALSPRGLIHEGRQPIGLAIALEQFAARFFGRGARPSGIIKVKPATANGVVTVDALNKVRTAWNAAHGGGNSGGTAVLPADADWVSVTLSAVDAQYNEQRQYAIAEIARLFRVPVHMLFQMDRATWSNVAEMGQEFVTYSLLNWITRWQDELSLKLLSPEDRSKFCIEFDFENFLQVDFDKRVEAYSKAIAARVMNPNESRSRLGLPRYEGGDEFINPAIQTANLT